MTQLTFRPDQDGYAVTFGNEVVSTSLDGGFSRNRRDKLGAPHTVNVRWSLNPQEYTDLMAFYRVTTLGGSLGFETKLVIDSSEAELYNCRFIGGTIRLESLKGELHVVAAQLEVESDYG